MAGTDGSDIVPRILKNLDIAPRTREAADYHYVQTSMLSAVEISNFLVNFPPTYFPFNPFNFLSNFLITSAFKLPGRQSSCSAVCIRSILRKH